MSSRRRSRGPTIASSVGLIRFYEEVEEKIKIPPNIILILAYATAIIVLVLRLFIRII